MKKNKFKLSNFTISVLKSNGFDLKDWKPKAHPVSCGAYQNKNEIIHIGAIGQKNP